MTVMFRNPKTGEYRAMHNVYNVRDWMIRRGGKPVRVWRIVTKKDVSFVVQEYNEIAEVVE